MEQVQFDQLVEKVGQQAAEKIKSETEALKAENTATKSQVEKLEEAMRKQGEEMTKMKDAQVTGVAKSFRQLLKEQLTSKAADFAAMKDNAGASVALKASSILTGSILPAVATAAPYSLTQLEAGITNLVRRQPFLRQIMNVSPISTMYAAWAEQSTPSGTAGATAEGAAKNQIDFKVQEATMKVEKVTAFIKTSKENLADMQNLLAEIEGELMNTVELALDSALYSGNGTSPILKGIKTYATTFNVTGTPFATGVYVPNYMDVIRVSAALVAANNFTANYALINPQDAAMMDLAKNGSGGLYVIPPFTTADGTKIAGITIIENNGVPVGDFLVGDFTKSNLRMREELNISIGYDGNDFTNNLVTILAETRACHYVKTNHLPAFVKGTFSTAITAITHP